VVDRFLERNPPLTAGEARYLGLLRNTAHAPLRGRGSCSRRVSHSAQRSR
jgi:hypothetical protein